MAPTKRSKTTKRPTAVVKAKAKGAPGAEESERTPRQKALARVARRRAPSTSKETTPRPRLSDESVKKATGKTWDEWARLLDARGAAGLPHAPITELVSAYGVSGWWSQMVTVGYEQMRGKRVEHETTHGFSVSASKTVPISAEAAFRLWNDPKQRSRWLPGARLTVRKATPAKSLRITWEADGTNVQVGLYPKGPSKSQIAVQHDKLPDAETGARMQSFWRERLDALAALSPVSLRD
jgi:hypothetical protein